MTERSLLALISAALLLQLVAWIGAVVWRRRGAPAAASATAPGGIEAAAAPAVAGAWPGWRAFRIRQRAFEDASQTQCSFELEPVDGAPLPAFRPGQFLTFRVQVAAGLTDGLTDRLTDGPAAGGANATGSAAAPDRRPALTRCYSLSDRPAASHYRVTIKRAPRPADRPDAPPGACSTYFHDRIHAGDVVEVKAPSGHFCIDPDPTIPVVLIGGGIGITPMFSMLQWCVAEQPGRTVHLFHGARCGAEQAFKQPLEQLAAAHPNVHLHVVYSHPGRDDVLGRDYHAAGHVDIDLLRRTLPLGRRKFYVCGPPPMMASLLPALAAWGVPAEDIHSEAFGPASVRAIPAALSFATAATRSGGSAAAAGSAALAGSSRPAGGSAAPFDVRFERSGRTLAWDGQDATLLDFAERHGVPIEAGCRSGGCGTCETRVVSGTVRYASPPDHDIAPGHCLVCVGTPEAALVLEA